MTLLTPGAAAPASLDRPSARLREPERGRFRQLYAESCLLAHLAARLDDHADRRERRLGAPDYPQQHDRARKVIADLRGRARAARVDQAVVFGMIEALGVGQAG